MVRDKGKEGTTRAAKSATRANKPLGAAQFEGIVKTKIARAKPIKMQSVRKRVELPDGLSNATIKELAETECRYAASRRAARSNGREALYE